MRFEVVDVGSKRKTKVYNVVSIEYGTILGRIHWHWPWRQYVFEPSPNTIWSRGCQEEVTNFLEKLMKERKQ